VFERFGDERIGIGLEVCFCRRSTVESVNCAVHRINRSLFSDDEDRARSIPLTGVATVFVGATFASTSWEFRHRHRLPGLGGTYEKPFAAGEGYDEHPRFPVKLGSVGHAASDAGRGGLCPGGSKKE
jgi:hypothetical protein